MTLIIKSDNESAIAAAIERQFKDGELEILQSEDEQYTTEEILRFLAYNTKQLRVYVGRLERNTRRVDDGIGDLIKTLEPISAFFTFLLAENGVDESLAKMLLSHRKATAASHLKPKPEIRPLVVTKE